MLSLLLDESAARPHSPWRIVTVILAGLVVGAVLALTIWG